MSFVPASVTALAQARSDELAEQGRAVRAVQYRRLGLGIYAVVLNHTTFSTASRNNEPLTVLVYAEGEDSSQPATLLLERSCRNLSNLDRTETLVG